MSDCDARTRRATLSIMHESWYRLCVVASQDSGTVFAWSIHTKPSAVFARRRVNIFSLFRWRRTHTTISHLREHTTSNQDLQGSKNPGSNTTNRKDTSKKQSAMVPIQEQVEYAFLSTSQPFLPHQTISDEMNGDNNQPMQPSFFNMPPKNRFHEEELEDISPIPLFPSQKANQQQHAFGNNDLSKITNHQNMVLQDAFLEPVNNLRQNPSPANAGLFSLQNSQSTVTQGSQGTINTMQPQYDNHLLPQQPLLPAPTQELIVPGDYDVISGRSSTAFNNVGNRRFRFFIARCLPAYLKASSRNAKSRLIIETAQRFQDETKARFLKQKAGGIFVLLSDKEVRSKVGHALRDMAANRKGATKSGSCPSSPKSEEKRSA